MELRVRRIAKRDNLSLEAANQKILARDDEEEERNVFERLYGLLNPYNEKWIDLTIDSSDKSPEELAATVIRVLHNQKTSLV